MSSSSPIPMLLPVLLQSLKEGCLQMPLQWYLGPGQTLNLRKSLIRSQVETRVQRSGTNDGKVCPLGWFPFLSKIKKIGGLVHRYSKLSFFYFYYFFKKTSLVLSAWKSRKLSIPQENLVQKSSVIQSVRELLAVHRKNVIIFFLCGQREREKNKKT